jgi:hypothetical protein
LPGTIVLSYVEEQPISGINYQEKQAELRVPLFLPSGDILSKKLNIDPGTR